MNSWKVIFATLVIFGAGVITGAMVVNLSHRVAVVAPSPAVPTPPLHARQQQEQKQQTDLLHRMTRELELTTEQHRKLERVLKDSQRRSKVIRDQMQPHLKEELERVRGEVFAVLTPDQQKKFDALPNANNLNMYNARKQEKPEEDRKKKKKLMPTNSAPSGFPGSRTGSNAPVAPAPSTAPVPNNP